MSHWDDMTKLFEEAGIRYAYREDVLPTTGKVKTAGYDGSKVILTGIDANSEYHFQEDGTLIGTFDTNEDNFIEAETVLKERKEEKDPTWDTDLDPKTPIKPLVDGLKFSDEDEDEVDLPEDEKLNAPAVTDSEMDNFIKKFNKAVKN